MDEPDAGCGFVHVAAGEMEGADVNKIQRYSVLGASGYSAESEVGDFVRFDDHASTVADFQTALTTVTNERDRLLSLCREMRTWLRPEVTKEPDRTFFWKLFIEIQNCESAIALRLSPEEKGQ